jgi:serine/threonine-protein kinase
MPGLQARFRREAEAAAGLDHPNLVAVHEVGEVGPWLYIVSAYCPGPSLADFLQGRSEPIPAPVAARVVADLARAVAYMHGRGVLHRDIKPGNILLQISDSRFEIADFKSELSNLQSAIPKLTDFGLAKVPDATLHHTPTGAVLGTPAYMSPEQAAGRTQEVRPAADVYALGVVLYELLIGRPPFEGTTALEVLKQVVAIEPVPPRRTRRTARGTRRPLRSASRSRSVGAWEDRSSRLPSSTGRCRSPTRWPTAPRRTARRT